MLESSSPTTAEGATDPGAGPGAATGALSVAHADGRSCAEVDAELSQLRRDLWGARDAAIGAEAEAATLRVRNKDLEVTIGQINQLLIDQEQVVRVLARIRSHRLVKGAARAARSVVGTPAPTEPPD